MDNLPLMKTYKPEMVCSFKEEDHCDHSVKKGLFPRVDLYDGTPLVVSKLQIVTHDIYPQASAH